MILNGSVEMQKGMKNSRKDEYIGKSKCWLFKIIIISSGFKLYTELKYMTIAQKAGVE